MALIGDSIQATFATYDPTTAVKTAADSLPTATLRKNGVDTGAVVTVTDRTGGLYSVSVTLSSSAPQSFVTGDTWTLEATWTLGGTADLGCVVAQGLIRAQGALESTLDDIKGAGWTNEDLVALKAAVDLKLDTSAYVAPHNTEIDAIKGVTDKLDTTLELDGAGPDYQFKAAALDQAPGAGGGGGTDWTAPEKEQIRQALGVTGTKSATDGTGHVDAVKAKTDLIPAGGPLAASAYVAPDNTKIGQIKTIADKLDTALELDGAVYRLTLNALELAPVGSLVVPTAAEIVAEMDANSTQLIELVSLVEALQARLTLARALLLDNLVRLDIPVSEAATGGPVTAQLSRADLQKILDAIRHYS